MKKYLKRFLAVFPAVLILILNIIPLSSFAEAYYGAEGLTRPADYSKDLSNLTGSDFGFGDDKPYIVMRYNGYRFTYIAVQCQGDYSFEEKDGIYTIVFSEIYSCYGKTDGGRWTSWEDGWSHYWSEFTIIYDSNSQKLLRNDLPYGSFGSDVTAFETNADKQTDSMPDIQVEFNPNLSGTVDRRISNGSNTSLLQDLNFTITNYSKFAVQYKFWIDLKNPVTTRNGQFDSSDKKGYYETHYDDDPVFVYYSNERVYSVIDTESASGMFSPQNVALFDKPSEWHYLKAGETFSEVFPFAMINLTEGTDYVVHVWVNKCDYDHPSTNLMTSEDTPAQEGYPANPNYKEVDQKYRYHFDSDFSMLQYSDVKYDPTIKAGSSLPYDGSKGISNQEQYRYMYDAKTDLTTGETNIGHVDLYNDPHSWVNKNYVYSPSYTSSGSSSFKFSNLLASTSSFFSFFSAVLGYFPPILLEVVSLALLSFLTIAIIRRIH